MKTQFILNNKEVITDSHPGLLVLDFLRQSEKLVGTKEGCREGDCGACTVIIGEIENGSMAYNPITSCLMPVGELHGKHLVTIEGLNLEELTPVQAAIVEEGATQCGFCIPGIVVSMTAGLMETNAHISQDSVKRSLSGHLCRCTGYRSLKSCTSYLQESFGKVMNLNTLIAKGGLPEYFKSIPDRLKKIPSSTSPDGVNSDYFIAGGTDIYIQEGTQLPESSVSILNLHPEMKGISIKNGHIRVGALTTFEEFSANDVVKKIIPHIEKYMFLNASWQIRNRATLGGNIINASPIADMTILLLALEAELVLENGSGNRIVPLTSFYKSYKQMDLKTAEILTEILIPNFVTKTNVHFEKVSKRKCLDIASVNMAMRKTGQNGFIEAIDLAIGGVAPIPFYLKETCSLLQDQAVTKDLVNEALSSIQQEIAPISDVRGSKDYKRLLAHQLAIKSFLTLFPDTLSAEDFYEKH